MSKSRRDRLNYYQKRMTLAFEPILSESGTHLQQIEAIKHGKKIYSNATIPNDVKKEILSNNPYSNVYYQNTNVSPNIRKQISTLKKRHNRIQRARNNRVVNYEINQHIKETHDDIAELQQQLANLGF